MSESAFRRAVAIGEKVAALRIELARARRHRRQLDNPLFVRVSEEPRQERRATDEEVSSWQASADAKIQALEAQIAELLREPAEPPPDAASEALSLIRRELEWFAGRYPQHASFGGRLFRTKTALATVEAALKARDERIAELEIRRRESRQLLHRFTKYVREDRAETPGVTRLARLTDQVADYLARTGEPNDVLRDDTAGVNGDG